MNDMAICTGFDPNTSLVKHKHYRYMVVTSLGCGGEQPSSGRHCKVPARDVSTGT